MQDATDEDGVAVDSIDDDVRAMHEGPAGSFKWPTHFGEFTKHIEDRVKVSKVALGLTDPKGLKSVSENLGQIDFGGARYLMTHAGRSDEPRL